MPKSQQKHRAKKRFSKPKPVSYFRTNDVWDTDWYKLSDNASASELIEHAFKLRMWYCNDEANEILTKVARMVSIKHEIQHLFNNDGEQTIGTN